ncbi:hypothetical protein [Catenulispora rubra]|uniref:hypothetical protein n=1 Tax=Catenulispora rubra TaxID=280293 RepID=UPI0018925285|nr:hypothetical protein [Catenulispora rubra]
MNSPAYPGQIDWSVAQKQAVDLVQLFLGTVDDQRNRVRRLEEHVQSLIHRLAAAEERLEVHRKSIQNLELSLRQARAQSEEEHTVLQERLTEVLERDFRNDNPNAATAVGFSRDEALDDMESLISSLWPIVTQHLNRVRKRGEPVEVVPVLAETVEILFGIADVDDGRLVQNIGNEHYSDVVRKMREIRDRLVACAPMHSWDFAIIQGEPLRPGQEAWRDCPADGLAQYVIRPGYIEGGRVIRNQVVFTAAWRP